MDSSELGFKLRKEFGSWDDGFDGEPDVQNVWGEYGDSQLVGNGEVTNEYCGKYLGLRGCKRLDLHDKITVSGENFKNKVFVHVVHHWCNKPSCPVCYKHGWAVRQAGRMELRLKEGAKRFGQVEHIVVSVPSKDYGLNWKALRAKVRRVLEDCGVVGGGIIPHDFRYDVRKGWFFSPHFHVLGFIRGGYGRCRRCKGGNCYACDGFEGRVYRLYRKNGYIVKVLGERKTIFGTAWYQLNHASIKKGVKRFHVVTWFGVCSYRKLKVTAERVKRVCPICGHDLVRMKYFGKRGIVTNPRSDNYVSWFVADVYEDGEDVWFAYEQVDGG